MKLTDPEKLIITMLCEIHKALKIKDGVNPDLVAEAIYSSNTWGLRWAYPGLFDSGERDPDTVREVCDILDMWSFLESGYEALDVAGKAQVEKDAAPFGKKVKFPGFDGNNETDYMSVAAFLVEKLDRFTALKGRARQNSHMPTLDGYRRMLKVFEPMRATIAGRELSAGEIAKVLNARRHPDA